MRDDRRLVVAVAPKEPVDDPETRVELGDGARIVVHALGQAARLLGDVGQLRLQARQPFGERLEAWIEAGQPARLLQGDRGGVAGAGSLLGERFAQGRRSPGDRLAMLGRRQTAADLVRLARSEVSARDLGRLVLEQVQAARHLPWIQRGRVERGPVLAPALHGTGHRRAELAVATEAVEQVALPALVEQAALVVLAVDLDHGADLVGQAGRR